MDDVDKFKKTNNEEFVNFLENMADGLYDRLTNIIKYKYNDSELLYFVDYIVCDLFQSLKFSNDVYWEIVNEFLKRHLFNKSIQKLKRMYYINKFQPYMIKLRIERDHRINEYRTNYPLLYSFWKGDSNTISKFIGNASKYIFGKRNSGFIKEIFPILADYQLTQIKKTRKSFIPVK